MKIMLIQEDVAVNVEHISVVRVAGGGVFVVMDNGLEYQVIRPNVSEKASGLFSWVTDSLVYA